MKKLLIPVLALVAMMSGLFAQQEVSFVPDDSFTSAKALALRPAKEYRMDFELEIDGEEFDGEAIMLPDGSIIEFEFDHEVYTTREDGVSLDGLHFPDVGNVEELTIWVDGVDTDGEYVSYGRENIDNYRPGDPIFVTLRPEGHVQFVHFDKPSGVNAGDIEIVDADNGNAMATYQSWLGGFRVWVDPLDGPVKFRIENALTGEVYRNGHLEPFIRYDDNEYSGTSAVSFAYTGGVRRIDLQNNHDNFRHEEFTGTTAYDGQAFPATSYFLEGDRNSDHTTDFWYVGTANVRIVVREVIEGEEDIVLHDDVVRHQSEWGNAYQSIRISAGGNAVVVTVMPVSADFVGDADFRLHVSNGNSKG